MRNGTLLTLSPSSRRWAATALLYLVYTLLDPFGIDGALQRHAREAVSRALGLCYERPLCIPSRREREPSRVAVVLVDRAYVDAPERGGQWPLPWTDYAALLRGILAHRPKAVFLDFVFQKPRQDDDLRILAEVLAEAREDEVPVLLGDILAPQSWNAPPYLDCGTPGLRQDRRVAGLTNTRIACAAAETVPVHWPDEAFVSHYPMAVVPGGTPYGADIGALRTPAPALFRRIHGQEKAFEDVSEEDKMLVAWDLRGSPLEHRRTADGCDRTPLLLAIPGALLPGLERLALEQFRPPERRIEPCLPLDTVSARQVEQGAPDVLHGGAEGGDLLEGRVVLVGSGRGPDDPDTVVTPLGGQVPGVLLHAMALDNLVRFGPEGYWWFRERTTFGLLGLSELATGIAALLGFLASRFAPMRWLPLAVTSMAMIGLWVLLGFSRVELLVALITLWIIQQVLSLTAGIEHELEGGTERAGAAVPAAEAASLPAPSLPPSGGHPPTIRF